MLGTSLIPSDFVVHSFRPPMEGDEQVVEPVGVILKPLRSWNGERRVVACRGACEPRGWKFHCKDGAHGETGRQRAPGDSASHRGADPDGS